MRGAKRLHENLQAQKDEAFLFRQLTRLRLDVPLKETLEDLRWRGPASHFADFCESLGAPRLVTRLPERE